MAGKRDSFIFLSTKKWKQRLGFGLDDDEIQSKVLDATLDNNGTNDLSSFSEVVALTSSGSEKALKTLVAVHRVIISDEWHVAFKGLQLLNYLLHYGGDEVLHWVLEHLRSLEEFARNLDDQHHKRVLQEQLRAIRLLVEDNWQLEKEREDALHNEWMWKVTRPPPARPGPGYILPNASVDIPDPTPTPTSSTRVSPSGSVSSSTAPLNLAPQDKPSPVTWGMGMSVEGGSRQQNQGGMDKAVGFPTADRGGNSRTQRKDLPVTLPDLVTGGSRETHRKMVIVLTLQAIHMLLACQSIIEFLQKNGDKMLFSRESDAELWKVYLSRVSKRGTFSVNQCREELAQYLQNTERDPSGKLNRLGSSILEKAIKEMQQLSPSLENFVKFGGVCIFADDALGLASHRLFSEPGKEKFDFVDEWEVQISEIAARNRDSIMGDMNGEEEPDLQFRQTHLDLALAMRKIAAQFVEFAWTSGSGSSVKFKELYTSKPFASEVAALTQTRHEGPKEEPSLAFLTASQDSEYKVRFVALVDEGSHVISREQTTAAIRRLNIHPRSVAHIWEAVGDVTSSNELYYPEFALAMYLGNELREGRSIPLKLPPTIKKNVEHQLRLVRTHTTLKGSNMWATKYRQKTDDNIPEKGQQDEAEDGTLPRANEVKLPREAEKERRVQADEQLESEEAFVAEEQRQVEQEENQVLEAAAKAEAEEQRQVEEEKRQFEEEEEGEEDRLLEAALEAEAEKHRQIEEEMGQFEEEEEEDRLLEAALEAEAEKYRQVEEEMGQFEEEEEEDRLLEAALEAEAEKHRQVEEEMEQFEEEEEEEEDRFLKAAAEAEAEERRQQAAEGQQQPADAQQKRKMEIQRKQEAKSGDQEGCDGSTGEKSSDTVENLVMAGEETERHIAVSTVEGNNPQLVDISAQSERPKTFDGHDEDSRKQTLTRGRETPTPLTGEGIATGTQMPQHRQTEFLGFPNDRHQTPSPQLRVQRQHTPSSDLSSLSSSRIISDLVRDSKLETAFAPNGQVVHVSYATNPRMRRHRVRKEEIWERQSELGSGAFGRVWLEKCAKGDDIGKLRAVKEITKLQRQSRSSEIDYNRELEAIAKFSHKKYVHCFVQSFGWFESEEAIFIAMEYLEHGDLQSHLDRPFPEDEVRDIVFQLLEGLSFMHENGFAHRDLKPANILVSEHSPNWWVKISDFGISKRAEEEATAFRTLVGTRGYIAPEVIGIYCPEDIDTIADSSSLYTVAVDLWALGAIMFKMLTHETIFAEPLELARYVTARRPFPRALVSEKGASEACVRFLEQAMAHSPTSRPSSSQALAHEWLADLSNLADSSEEFPDTVSTSTGLSTGLSTGQFTSVAGESTASAAWPSTFS
ncbi:unnamed protein product [Clonostachys solani]|uniref:Autophagy-related protein 1 n=1 Tax=Clonostachys solani TaxID=160281 RepID=A0A9N9ZIV0_9HYPO|nr:unnamed protein product [Clonostachys solani]